MSPIRSGGPDAGIARSGYAGPLAKWLPDPRPLPSSLQTSWTGLCNGVQSAMTCEPLRDRDTFDCDDAPKGKNDNPAEQAALSLGGKLVGLVQKDADTFCVGGSKPVRITGGNRR